MESAEPRIETIPPKKAVGMRLRMTLSQNRTYELWHGFMPRRKEIKNCITTDLLSIQVFDKNLDFNNFNPDTEFEKWAATEVSGFEAVPAGMEEFTIAGGVYAVFNYKGTPGEFPEMFNYIFRNWLPGSRYSLENRPHFEILGKKYKHDDPSSEEEIWIPVKSK
jgi:AraC family transcriptional regulator